MTWGVWCECHPPEDIPDDGLWVRRGWKGWLLSAGTPITFTSKRAAEKDAASLRSKLEPTRWWTFTARRMGPDVLTSNQLRDAVVEAARDLVENHFDPAFGTLDTSNLKPTDEVNQKVGALWNALRALDGT